MSYEELFRLIDIDQNGELSLSEFTAFCETLPNAPAPNVVARLFGKADVDGSGFIDINEFGALCEGVKMLAKLSERELCDAYSISELKRLFQYSASNGTCLRRDEVRKAVDVVVEGLNLKLSNDAIATAIREGGGDEVDFIGFRNLLGRIAPAHSLGNIVRAFKEEETRRKERLSKVKSVFESRAKPTQRQLSSSTAPSKPGEPCQRCDGLQQELEETLTKQEMNMQQIQELKFRIGSLTEEAANVEVKHQIELQGVHSQLSSAVNERDAALADLASLRADLHRAGDQLRERDEKLSMLQASTKDLEQSKQSNEALRDEADGLHRELERANAKVERLELELSQLRNDLAAAKTTIDEFAEERQRSSAMLEHLAASKASESQQAEAVIEAMKQRCEEREAQALAASARAEVVMLRAQALEKEVSQREDQLTTREKEVKKLNATMKAKWENQFVKAQNELDVRAKQLSELETEMATLSAELQVREQLLDQNVRRAESISLPERERRLRLLQGIEAELCLRERKLRQGEAEYLSQLLDPELVRLRNENQKLRETVEEMKAARDSSSLFLAGSPSNTRSTKKGLERSLLSPSFKLL